MEENNLKYLIDAALIISGALLVSACIIANEDTLMLIGTLPWVIEIALCIVRKIKNKGFDFDEKSDDAE